MINHLRDHHEMGIRRYKNLHWIGPGYMIMLRSTALETAMKWRLGAIKVYIGLVQVLRLHDGVDRMNPHHVTLKLNYLRP